MKIKGILFDFNGTMLFDSALQEDVWKKFLRHKIGREITNEEIHKYIHGANNPVGIRQKHHFPIFIDYSALTRKTIIVSAGELGHSIEINAKDLADFVEADFADLKEN